MRIPNIHNSVGDFYFFRFFSMPRIKHAGVLTSRDIKENQRRDIFVQSLFTGSGLRSLHLAAMRSCELRVSSLRVVVSVSRASSPCLGRLHASSRFPHPIFIFVFFWSDFRYVDFFPVSLSSRLYAPSVLLITFFMNKVFFAYASLIMLFSNIRICGFRILDKDAHSISVTIVFHNLITVLFYCPVSNYRNLHLQIFLWKRNWEKSDNDIVQNFPGDWNREKCIGIPV